MAAGQIAAFADDYVRAWVELDDWEAQLRQLKQAAKAALDENRKNRQDQAGRSKVFAAQRALTQTRTRAALETLLRIEKGEAPPELRMAELALPHGRYLIQHFCNDQGFQSDLQLQWDARELTFPYDAAAGRAFLAAIGARYHRHLSLTEDQQRTRRSAARDRLGNQMKRLVAALEAAQHAALVEEQTQLPRLEARAMLPHEQDVTYSPEHRNLFRFEEGTGGGRVAISLQTTCAHRRKSHPLMAMAENEATADFYNKTIAPHTAHWVEVEVVVGDELIFTIKVREFFADNASVVYPFVAVAKTQTGDFRRREYTVVDFPPHVMQGTPSEIRTMGEAARASQWLPAGGIPGYTPLSEQTELVTLLRSDNLEIPIEQARAYYSVEDRKKGDSVVYFVCYGGVVLGVQIHTPQVRQLWYDWDAARPGVRFAEGGRGGRGGGRGGGGGRGSHRQPVPPRPNYDNQFPPPAWAQRQAQAWQTMLPGWHQQQQHGWNQWWHQQQIEGGQGVPPGYQVVGPGPAAHYDDRPPGQQAQPAAPAAPAPQAPRPRPPNARPQLPPNRAGGPLDRGDTYVAFHGFNVAETMVPTNIEVDDGRGSIVYALKSAARDMIVYITTDERDKIFAMRGLWLWRRSSGLTFFKVGKYRKTLTGAAAGEWAQEGVPTNKVQVTIRPRPETSTAQVTEPAPAPRPNVRGQYEAEGSFLPPQPRRMATRFGAAWQPTGESDLSAVMASLEEIKRALNDAQLLKDALTG